MKLCSLNEQVNNITKLDDNEKQEVSEKSHIDPHEEQLVNELNDCLLKNNYDPSQWI